MKVSFLLIILGFSQVLGRNCRGVNCGSLKKSTSDQLDTSCLPPFIFSMKWWARIGVTHQYIMDNVCKELFPELNSCWGKMIVLGLSFKNHVQTLLSVLTEKENHFKSKFCELQDDVFMGYPTDLISDCNKCRIAKISIAKGRKDDIDTEFTSILIMDFCQRITYHSIFDAKEKMCVREVKDIVPRVKNWFQRYVKTLDESQFCGHSCTMEADSPQQIEGNSIEDNNIEIGEMINNNLEYSEFAPSELEQPKTECDYIYGNGMETRCSSDEDCKQCSDCPEGVWCDLNFESDTYGPFCQCDEIRNYNEYDNSMDDFNAKSDEVQSENEEKIIELEELENNNLEYSEAAPSELEQPKKECGIKGSGTCSSQKDCKQCPDCPNGAECVAMGWIPMKGGNGECRCHGYIDCGMFC